MQVNGSHFKLYDFPIVELDEIAAAHDTTWLQVVSGPAATLGLAAEVIKRGCSKMSVPMPVLSARNMLDFLEQVPDDLPEAYDAEGLPEGSAGVPLEGEPATTTS